MSEYALYKDTIYENLNSMYKESCYLNHATPLYLMFSMEREGFINVHAPLIYATFFMHRVTLYYIQEQISSFTEESGSLVLTLIGVYIGFTNKVLQSLEEKGVKVNEK